MTGTVELNTNNSIIRNKLDVLLLLFYVFLFINLFIAFFNGVDLLDWITEYILFLLLLFYFPIREYFDDEKSLTILLVLFFIVIIILSINQFYGYKQRVLEAAFAYQVGKSGKLAVNQQIYTSVVIAGATFMFYSKTIYGKISAFVISVISTAAIISTFSRAFWLALMLMLFLLIFFLNYKQTVKLFGIIIITAGIIIASVYMIVPKQAKFVTKYATNMLSSSTKGSSDVSVRARLYEYRVVFEKIKESPIGGQGLRKDFSFYSPIPKYNVRFSFVHNGYLSLAYRVGIPIATLFYIAILAFMIKGFITAWKLRKYELIRKKKTLTNAFYDIKNDATFENATVETNKDDNINISSLNRYIGIAICASLSLFMLFITNFITSSFFFRDGLMVAAFSIAFIGIAEKKFNQIN